MHRILIFSLFILCFPTTGANAESDITEEDYREFNDGIAKHYVIPHYVNLASAFAELKSGSIDFCHNKDAERLSDLRASFSHAVNRWMRIEHIRFGPSGLYMRSHRIMFWPDRRNSVSKHLNEILTKRDSELLELDTFKNQSVAIQGIPALERLLWGEWHYDLLDESPGSQFHCSLVIAIATNLSVMMDALINDWQNGEHSFVEQQRDAGSPNSLWLAPSEITQQYLGSYTSGLQRIADLKLGGGLGESIAEAKPKRTEMWRSESGLANLIANIEGLTVMYTASNGLSSLLIEKANRPELDMTISTALKNLNSMVLMLSTPLHDAVQDAEQRQTLDDIRSAIVSLRQVSLDAFGEALGLHSGFNDLDGD